MYALGALAKTDTSMGYFKEQEMPFQFALANAFTLCDAYHCSHAHRHRRQPLVPPDRHQRRHCRGSAAR